MSLKKKTKVDSEWRIFQEKMDTEYFLGGWELITNLFNLLLKEFNVRQHYGTYPAKKYRWYTGQARTDKVNDLSCQVPLGEHFIKIEDEVLLNYSFSVMW